MQCIHSDTMDDRMSYLHQRDPSIDRRYRPRPRNQFNLINAISEDEIEMGADVEAESTSSSSSTTTMTDNDAAVYLRLRPTTCPGRNYSLNGNVMIVQNVDDKKEKHYTFTDVFNDDAKQAAIYNTCVFPYIQECENLTVLTYGTSGSGKTYTMHGSELECGIISRAIKHIFVQYGRTVITKPGMGLDARGNFMMLSLSNYREENELREKYTKLFAPDEFQSKLSHIMDQHPNFVDGNMDSSKQMTAIWVSFAEIYNEFVYDLLDVDVDKKLMQKKKRENLKIIGNDGNAFIKGLRTVHVRNAEDAIAIMQAGMRNIQTAFTNVNDQSSRSHCIFMIDVVAKDHTGAIEIIKYKFCDLAGSERLKKTQNEGTRLREAQGINTSLSMLGRCLETTYRNQMLGSNKTKEVVPYRDSKLTMLLQKPLQGREKLITIVNLCTADAYLEENLHVLGFAAMAQQIVQVVAPPPKRKRRSSQLFHRSRSTRFSWMMDEPEVDRHNHSAEANYLTQCNLEYVSDSDFVVIPFKLLIFSIFIYSTAWRTRTRSSRNCCKRPTTMPSSTIRSCARNWWMTSRSDRRPCVRDTIDTSRPWKTNTK